MKNVKRLITLLLASALILANTVGCTTAEDTESSSQESSTSSASESSEDTSETEGGDEAEKVGNINVTGYPIADEAITYTIMNKRSNLDKSASQNEKAMVAQATEETNIIIEWTETTESAYAEQYDLMLATGEGLPDAFMTWPNETQIASNTQRFYEITDEVLEQYAPNIYSQFIENVDGGLDVLRKNDGKIYSLPVGIWSSYTNEANSILFINNEWMQTLGITEMPTNIDELYNVMVSFKNDDPNGNGQQDEIPFLFAQSNWAAKLQILAGSWGITGRNLNNDSWFGTVEDGTYSLNIDTQAFRDFLTEMNKWYEAGLINIDGFSMNGSEFNSVVAQDIHGMYGSWSPTVDDYKNEVWVGMPVIPAVGYEGQEVKSGESGPITANKNGFMITSDCEEPLGLLRWWDYFHKDTETKRIACYGPEGTTWSANEDGTAYAFDPDPIPSGFSNVSELHNTYGWRAANSPVIFGDEEARPNPDVLSADSIRYELGDYYSDYYLDEFIPVTPVPADVAEDFSFTKTEIENHVQTFMADSVSHGITDESWNTYLSELEAFGIAEWVEYYQNYVDGTFN